MQNEKILITEEALETHTTTFSEIGKITGGTAVDTEEQISPTEADATSSPEENFDVSEEAQSGAETDAATEESTVPPDAPLSEDDAASESSEPVEEPVSEDDTDALRRELQELREELKRRDELTARLDAEGRQFRLLYPDVDPMSLPDSVWDRVREGVPLAAAYALCERIRLCTEKKAEAANQANRKRAAGSIESTECDYFSPAEVRRMSAAEVRTNYSKIMLSMQKWH